MCPAPERKLIKDPCKRNQHLLEAPQRSLGTAQRNQKHVLISRAPPRRIHVCGILWRWDDELLPEPVSENSFLMASAMKCVAERGRTMPVGSAHARGDSKAYRHRLEIVATTATTVRGTHSDDNAGHYMLSPYVGTSPVRDIKLLPWF